MVCEDTISRLNIGCGRDIRRGWTNLDAFPGDGVDVVCDLNGHALPFPDRSFDHILASHVLEHILDWESIVMECYRVLRPGGTLEVRVPYKLRGLDSIYHVRLFSPSTMDGFCMKEERQRETAGLQRLTDFKKVKVKVNREFGLSWHFERYLHWKVNPSFGLRKHEIVWILRKPEK